MLQKLIIFGLAMGVTTLAVADENLVAETVDSQTIDSGSAGLDGDDGLERTRRHRIAALGGPDDNMTDFLATIPADADLYSQFADRSAASLVAGRQHQKHLGLGFAHGMGDSRSPQGNAPPGASSPFPGGGNQGAAGVINHNDKCKGNGHPGNPGGNGNGNGNGNGPPPHVQPGQGHFEYGNGNGFGHADCGEPSPN